MDVVVLGGVVQHRVEVHLVDLRDGADVARHRRSRTSTCSLPCSMKQVADLEGLAAVADVELAVAA